MDARLEKYLDTIDKHLKPLPASERVDIVKEVKASMLEMQADGLATEQILSRLGDAKDLARAYLGDLLAESSGLSWTRILTICAFYSLVGFSGMIVIPCLAIMAPVFIACGIFCPLAGTAKLVDYLFNLGIPWMDNVGVFLFGPDPLGPVATFFVLLVLGAVLIILGRLCWKLLVGYCKKVGQVKRHFSI
ncbi:MAG: DUF1700 domain-containing protein [Peptococcaceae bacterium]|nr:DUF1700 domain-containing protein [Peptococcaceae bacterium]